MIEELIREIEELEKYRQKYENAEKEKQVMSEMLFKYMEDEYQKTSYEARSEKYRNDICSACRYRPECTIKFGLPKDISKPIPSDKSWVPSRKSCGNFMWS